MRVPADARIAKASAGREYKPALSEPWLDEAGNLIATDSVILAIVPVELEPDDTPGPVPRKALKAAGPRGAIALGEEAVVTRKSGERRSYDRPATDPPKAIPKLLAEHSRRIKSDVVVLLDATYLHRLAQAIGTRQVRLTVRRGKDGALQPILVEPLNGISEVAGGAWGLLMPIRPPKGGA